MSINTLLNIGRTAIYASQTQLTVTGNNIANAMTPGYCRQEVILGVSSTICPNGQTPTSQGVSVLAIKRHYDALLQQQIFSTQQDYGRATTLHQTLSAVEQLFNESQGLGVSESLVEFFNAWQDVASHPEGLTERSLLWHKADTLVTVIQRLERGLIDALESIERGLDEAVDQVNRLAEQIAQLNRQIVQYEGGSTTLSANTLRDQRDALLKELCHLADIAYWEDPDSGSITVTIGMKTLVDGDTSHTFSLVADEVDGSRLFLDGQEVTVRMVDGKIGGLLAAREEISDHSLRDLRKFTAALTLAVNGQHQQGYGLDGSTGRDFFHPLELSLVDRAPSAGMTASIIDPESLTLEEYIIRFQGGQYEVYNLATGGLETFGVYDPDGTTIEWEGMRWEISGTVNDGDSFQVSPLTQSVARFGTALTALEQIAAAATAAGVPGDNQNALALAGLLNESLNPLGAMTLSGFYQTLVGRIGLQNQGAADALTFTENLLNALNDRRESVSGVSLDEEAANLIRFQQAYQAAARLIRTAEELFETLIQM